MYEIEEDHGDSEFYRGPHQFRRMWVWTATATTTTSSSTNSMSHFTMQTRLHVIEHKPFCMETLIGDENVAWALMSWAVMMLWPFFDSEKYTCKKCQISFGHDYLSTSLEQKMQSRWKWSLFCSVWNPAVYTVTCPPTDAAAVAEALQPVFPFINMF
jgi:hypothetical protein